jgi:REP element-mobilizing transposase RayT
VCCRGNRRQPIFLARGDELVFLGLLAEVVVGFGWQCLSYCVMPNHYHLLLYAEREKLSKGMHRLNGIYAQRFNRRYGLDGHLFQDRFYVSVVESDWHLLEATRYLPLNPVRAGLREHPADWAGSSYRALAGLEPAPAFLAADELLAHFGRDRRAAEAAFAAFVAEGIALGRGMSPA